MSEERQMTGAVMRADKAWVEKHGLLEQVRARLPADSAALFDKPPLPITWIPARHIDDLLDAVHALAGEEKLLRGATSSFEKEGDHEGRLKLRTVDKPSRAWLLQWKGTLRSWS